MNKKITLIFILSAILAISVMPLSAAALDSNWHQFQKDEINIGVTYSPAPIEDAELAWSAFTYGSEMGNGIDVTPIIAGDMVYIYAANGSIWAFDKTSGDLMWKNETTGGNLQTSIPAYGDGNIFVAAESGDLFAFNATTGEELWNVHATDRNFQCPITYFDHKIYVAEGLEGGVTTKYYYCYDDNGTQLWNHSTDNTGGFLWCGASVVADYLVYATHEGKLISLYKENGTLTDEVDLTSDLSFSRPDLGKVRASVTYHNGYIYTTSEKGQPLGYVFKVGFDNGTFVDDGWGTANGFSTSTPVVYDGKVYVGQGEHGFTGNLTCLNDSTGEIIWSYFIDAGVKSSPAIAIQNGKPYIYFTGAKTDGALYCLNADGTLAWEYNPPDGGYVLQGAAISDGFVYFGTDAGYIYCLKEKPGMAQGYWTPDSGVVSGLSGNISMSAPTVFSKDGIGYLISGADDGTFYGYNWTGSAWQEDDAIVSGLGYVGNQSAPAVFCMNDTWYLIAGRMHGFNGFNWTGSTWQQDDSIVSGLAASYAPGDTNYLNKPEVFYKDGAWYLISGNMPQWTWGGWELQMRFLGHKWTGSAWEDSGIVSGLPCSYLWHSAPAVFYVDNVWYLISGYGSGEFSGWHQVGSTWQPDDAVTLGLRDVGSRSTPTVFDMNGTWYLISGEGSGGFYGFRYITTATIPPDFIPTSLQPTTFTVNRTANVTVTVKNEGGTAGSFNVSLKLNEAIIGMKTVDSMSAGEEKPVNFTFTPASGGIFNMTATVDPDGTITELNEENNVIVETVTILRPDLIPASLQSTILLVNETNTITANIKNDGGVPAGSFSVSLKLDETVIGTKTIDSLDMGEEKPVNFTYTPTLPGRTFNLTVTADTENVIEESNETNNNLTIPARTNVIWYVHEGESIQAAIDNASAYDTIIVYPDTYSGVTVNKRLNMEGIDHPVIDGGIYIEAGGTTVRGFKIIHASTGIQSQFRDAGYFDDMFIEDNIIESASNIAIVMFPTLEDYIPGGVVHVVRKNTISATGSAFNGWGAAFHRGEWPEEPVSFSFFIYLNNFINGTNTGMPAYDYLTAHSPEKVTYIYEGNTYTNYIGNYWEAYDGSDANGDGIGDTPYMYCQGEYSWIPNSYDYYPLIQSFANYAMLEAQPDLSVELISTPGSIYTDTPNMVTATISNTGTGDAAAFDVTLYADDALVETETVDSLTVETTTNVVFRWMPTAAEDVSLKVVADAADVIAELDETNNELTKVVTVKESFSWHQFRKDAMCTGKTNSIAPTANVAVLWSRFTHYNTTHGIDVTPIVANGKAFVIDVDEYAWAFDAATGEPLWNTSLAQGPGFTLATPAYAAGKVFFATSTGYIYALDESNGTIIWSGKLTKGQNEGLSTQICYDDGRIYVGSLEGKYYCLEASGNGTEPKILWSETLANGGFDWWSKGTIINDFFVYGNTNAVIKSVYNENGTLIDEINLSTEYGVDAKSIRSGIVSDEGHIYLTSTGGYIYSIGFDAGAGTFGSGIWNTSIGHTTSTPVVYDGMVYAGCENGTFYALYASTGTAAWEHTPNGDVSSSPIISIQDGKPYVYFTTNCTNGSVYCLDKDGNKMWSYEADHPAYMLQGVAIANEKVYFGNGAGWLYCLKEKTPPSEGWTQFHKDVKHTGFSNSTAPNTNDTLWVSNNIGAVLSSSTVVAEGKVFVNCEDSLKALNEHTGNMLWSTPIESATELGSWLSPSYHDGKVFISGLKAYCIDATNGSTIWEYGLPSPACNGGTMVAGGKVFAGDWDGHHYYCWDEETGEKLRDFTVSGYAQGVAGYVDGKVYFTSWVYGDAHAGHVYCIDADTGEEIWHQNNIPQNCCGSPTISNGIVYVTTFNFYGDGGIYALNASDGSILWNQTMQRTDSTPVVAYGNVYVCGGCVGYSDVQTYCFNATNGELMWNTTASDGIGGWTCSVAVADGKVFVGKPGEFFGYAGTYALDAFTGNVIWSYPEGGSSPAVADGMVFTIGGGKVYAFNGKKVPVLSFTHSPQNPVVNQTITFDASNSTAMDGNITNYEWNFGDGNFTNTTEHAITHIYGSAGTYIIHLTVTDDEGTTNSTTVTIIVHSPTPTYTTADAAIALSIAVGSCEYNPEMDINNDGKVTSLDALMILQVAGAVKL